MEDPLSMLLKADDEAKAKEKNERKNSNLSSTLPNEVRKDADP